MLHTDYNVVHLAGILVTFSTHPPSLPANFVHQLLNKNTEKISTQTVSSTVRRRIRERLERFAQISHHQTQLRSPKNQLDRFKLKWWLWCISRFCIFPQGDATKQRVVPVDNRRRAASAMRCGAQVCSGADCAGGKAEVSRLWTHPWGREPTLTSLPKIWFKKRAPLCIYMHLWDGMAAPVMQKVKRFVFFVFSIFLVDWMHQIPSRLPCFSIFE